MSLTRDGVGTTYRFETKVAGLPIRGRGEYTEVTPDRHIHDDTTVASELGIPAEVDAYGPGTHTWPYFERSLHGAMPMLMEALEN